MKYGWPFFNLEVEDVIITISPYHLFPFRPSPLPLLITVAQMKPTVHFFLPVKMNLKSIFETIIKFPFVHRYYCNEILNHCFMPA